MAQSPPTIHPKKVYIKSSKYIVPGKGSTLSPTVEFLIYSSSSSSLTRGKQRSHHLLRPVQPMFKVNKYAVGQQIVPFPPLQPRDVQRGLVIQPHTGFPPVLYSTLFGVLICHRKFFFEHLKLKVSILFFIF